MRGTVAFDAAGMRGPGKPSGSFGIAFDPFIGKIYATRASKLPEPVLCDPSGKDTTSKRVWTAEVIGWPSGSASNMENLVASGRLSVGVGLLISNGTLEFIQSGFGSGIVCEQLPAKVLCCACLFNFVGQAFVSIEEVRVLEPSVCTQMRGKIDHGELSPWTECPRRPC